MKKSETKVVLKPVCNDGCVILTRSVAQRRNCAIVVTLRLQTFGTRLRYKNYRLIINTFLVKNRLEQ